MRRRWQIACAAWIAVALASDRSTAAQADPRPAPAPARSVVLATSDGVLAEFGDPATNRSGWAIFHAVRKDGREGIYASSGGPPVPVAEAGGFVQDGPDRYTFKRFGRGPTVNDHLTCAFMAEFEEGGSAVLACEGFTQQYEFVADSGEAFRDFGDAVLINGSRQVVFQATVDPPNHPDSDGFDPRKIKDPHQLDDPSTIPPPTRATFDGRKESFHVGLFLDRGSDLQLVGGTHLDFLDVQEGCAFNDAGVVAFRASQRPKSWSLLVHTGGHLPLVLAESGARFTDFGRPAINGRGRVAFVARTPAVPTVAAGRSGAAVAGGAMVCRAFKGGGLPEVLADASMGYGAFGPEVAIDEEARVAFVASRGDGAQALFLARRADDVVQVLKAGDRIGRDRLVQAIRLSNRAFAGSSKLVVLVALEPAGEAVVLLHLAPASTRR